MKRIRKLLVGTLALAVAVTATVTLIGCNKGATLSFANAYNYSAIAGIGILNTEVDAGGNATFAAQTELNATQKEDIIGNLAIAQNIANNGIVRTNTGASDNPDYEFYYTVTATDYTGAQNEYAFYYNRTDITTREDLKENEREYRLDGIVILDGVTYAMTGEHEVEDNETEYTFKVAVDAQNYVLIEQEMETNEMEFNYTAYKNSVKVYEKEIEYEVDRNGNVQLEFEIFDNGVAKECEYEFYQNANGTFARVKIKNGNTTSVLATVKITQTQNGYNYEFI